MAATSHQVGWGSEVFAILLAAGVTLTVRGWMTIQKVRRLGPATSGRFKYTERRAPHYLRIGPPLLVVGLVGLLIVGW